MTQDVARNATLEQLHEMLLPNPAYRREYEALDLEFKVADAMIRARKKAGLTQAELAERMGTSRTAVVRLEGGRKLPTLETIRRVARATGQRIRLDVA